MKITNNFGFTLIEVLVVLSILSLFLLSAITVSIVSVRNLKSSENKILATRYAEGLSEWIRGQKESDWDIFIGKTGAWCFSEEPILTWPLSTGNCLPNEKISSIFERKAVISYDSALDRIISDVTVSWDEGSETVAVPISTILEKY
ncbi:hypothetical protein A3F29_03200 [Candidatus Roizmanbacteria bacterium RIFCSPHIGHO2_12_FULL_33_9]|uniref:Type II secretion system protein GspI C-terminal domain-containing protein n=1 Tax=Candidatus Roizmanbacteria bacterium RIFCSPHIGHO2_12_FULL_33_9 TaxID=1802045 RepID=A0A1F7HJ28_9BACT|nr:MAG: hypothetical protein A3F29_03200 [Candidatus Roizmanbacteria bacterium RIFCSPHIGHO2_12_FULL_33_9]